MTNQDLYQNSLKNTTSTFRNCSLTEKEDYNYENVEFNIEEGVEKSPLLLSRLTKVRFYKCDFEDTFKIARSSDILFEDLNISLNTINNCNNIIFKNCNINIDVMWVLASKNIKFKDCTINGDLTHIRNSNVSFENCKLKNLKKAIDSYNSNINIKHTIIRNCGTFIESDNSDIYARLIDLDRTTDEYLDVDKNTSINIISVPKLTISYI